jgi:hypothetical protein
MGDHSIGLRIRQYVYFSVRSAELDAAVMTARLGIEPDRVLVRGARQQEPPRPTLHAWEIVCDEPRLTIDEQVASVLARLRAR